MVSNRELYFNLFFLVVGVIITIAYFESCTEKPKTISKTEYRDTTIIIHDTVFKGEGKGKLKYTYSGVLRDTVIRNDSVFITVRDSTQFTATLDTIQRGDTLHLEYAFPESLFRYSLSRAPIEIRYTNTVTTNTVTVEPRKLSVGVQGGVGYVQPLGGVGGIGAYGGVGIGYLLY